MQTTFEQQIYNLEEDLLVKALEESKGHRLNASRILGLSYRSFRHYAGKHKLGSNTSAAWKESNQQAVEAHQAVKRAIDEGILIRPANCSACFKPARLEAHHKDYSKPLEVDWLCASCHRLEHSLTRREKRKQMFK